MYSINAQGYFNRDPERDTFYLISYQTCRRINVTWPSPYPEVKAFVKEATRVVYDQDKICWNGAPLSSVKSFHRDTACWVSLIFDHHLTTAVQMPCEMPEKPVVTTNNGLFSRFGLNCAEPINFTFQRWSMPPCRSSPTTATGQVLGLFLFDTALFTLAKMRWSTVVRPRIDHYWNWLLYKIEIRCNGVFHI